MTEPPLFDYTGRGQFPERLLLDMRNGLVRITVHGEPRMRADAIEEQVYDPEKAMEPGPVAELVLPAQTAALLAEALLKVPPVAELVDKVPFVCWFNDQAELNQFVTAIQRNARELEVMQLDPPQLENRSTNTGGSARRNPVALPGVQNKSRDNR